MKYRRLGLHDWQLNVGRFQLNWQSYSRDFPQLPWGLRVWKNQAHWFDLMWTPADTVRCANCLRLGHYWKRCPDAYYNRRLREKK